VIHELRTGESIEDVAAQVAREKRRVEGRPWLMLNMVSSIDGATAVDGGATPLSDDDDRELFHALRAVADVLLVGAGTVRAENYRPAKGLVVVTGRLDLDHDARVFSDATQRPTLLTRHDADPDKVARLSEVADVVPLPDLEGSTILDQLSDAGVILCEGGPTLNGHLVRADLVDEINWTVAPLAVSGDAKRMVVGTAVSPPVEMQLARVWQGDRSLFLRYVKAR